MKHHDLLVGAQARERGLELQRLVDRFVDELLDDLLAPRPERAAAKTAAEPLDTGKADAMHLARVAVEDADALRRRGSGESRRSAPRLEVVVAEHGHDGDLHGGRESLTNPRASSAVPVIGDVPC